HLPGGRQPRIRRARPRLGECLRLPAPLGRLPALRHRHRVRALPALPPRSRPRAAPPPQPRRRPPLARQPSVTTTSIPAQDRPHFRLWFALPHMIDIGMIFVAILGFDSSTELLLAVAAVAGICVGFIFLWGGFCDACGLKLSWLPYLYIGICAVK